MKVNILLKQIPMICEIRKALSIAWEQEIRSKENTSQNELFIIALTIEEKLISC